MDRRWATFALLLALLAGGSALVAVLGGGTDDGGPALRLSRSTAPGGAAELLVAVPEMLNVPETAGGRGTVGLECSDGRGRTVLRARHVWPLARDGEPPAPHVHQPVSARELGSIAGCRLTGTDPRLQGYLGRAR